MADGERDLLIEFLRACIAEERAKALAASARNGAIWSTEDLYGGTRITGTAELGNPRSYRGAAELWDDEGAMGMWPETAEHVALWDPDRVLDECDAKLRIIVRCEEMLSAAVPMAVHLARWTLMDLGRPYADRPGYRDKWRP